MEIIKRFEPENGALTERTRQMRDAILALNETTVEYGLTLSHEQATAVALAHDRALRSTGRVEFNQMELIKKLMQGFRTSPYLNQDDYGDVLCELLGAFYYFKNESLDRFGDDELIELMRRFFDERCKGSVEYLSGTLLEDLCRDMRQP